MNNQRKVRVLILGATGMLGSTLYRFLSLDHNLEVYGTLRSQKKIEHFSEKIREGLISGLDLESETGVLFAFSKLRPDVVINCVGIIKQSPKASDPLESLSINATLPHRLANYCRAMGARLIHFSTDCVFSGKKGQYLEDDFADANDLYGRTKYLGEVSNENTVTLRTSIIGHELDSCISLIDWFLCQEGTVRGFKKAIFSGLPTIEVARVVRDYILPNQELMGTYHLSAEPISKYELLKLVAQKYEQSILIIPDEDVVIDRSLNSGRFQAATGYSPLPWPELIESMHVEFGEFHAQDCSPS